MQPKRAMWTLEELQESKGTQICIDERWIPARPLNYRLCWCSILKRIWYAWQVVIGKTETFSWPGDQ